MRSEHRFSQGWAWPPEVREWVLERTHGRVLNICAGRSRIGDVQVDYDARLDPEVVADMNNMPVKPGSFDTVISDPPWNQDWYERRPPFYEAVRSAKPGGTILYNVPWRPTSTWVREVDSYRRVDAEWGEVSIVWEFERISHNSAAEAKW